MKVAMVIFSPSGNTLKAAKMLQNELANREISVQVIDVTRNGPVSDLRRLVKFLEENIPAHDVLCVGGPVYAHHLHYNVKNIIRALPRPGGKWGKSAVPIVTYGVISSGIALHEAGLLLRRSGRVPVCGMKLEAFHCMSRLLSTQVGLGLPGPASMPVIAALAERIARLDGENPERISDGTPSFNYQKPEGRLKARLIFREKFWHRHMYPKLAVAESLCRHCGKCVEVCPVQRIRLADGGLVMNQHPECIHCGECISECPAGALSFAGNLEKFNQVFAEAAEGKGPLPSREKPKSAIYPLA